MLRAPSCLGSETCEICDNPELSGKQRLQATTLHVLRQNAPPLFPFPGSLLKHSLNRYVRGPSLGLSTTTSFRWVCTSAYITVSRTQRGWLRVFLYKAQKDHRSLSGQLCDSCLCGEFFSPSTWTTRALSGSCWMTAPDPPESPGSRHLVPLSCHVSQKKEAQQTQK